MSLVERWSKLCCTVVRRCYTRNLDGLSFRVKLIILYSGKYISEFTKPCMYYRRNLFLSITWKILFFGKTRPALHNFCVFNDRTFLNAKIVFIIVVFKDGEHIPKCILILRLKKLYSHSYSDHGP